MNAIILYVLKPLTFGIILRLLTVFFLNNFSLNIYNDFLKNKIFSRSIQPFIVSSLANDIQERNITNLSYSKIIGLS